MLESAIRSLSALLGVSPKKDSWKEKAAALIQFAESVAREVLLRAGIPEHPAYQEQWNNNLIARDFSDDVVDDAPVDMFGELWLIDVPSLLNTEDSSQVAHHLLFGQGRVLDWDVENKCMISSMSYEEAARFVVFWLLEKILQIIKENRWDVMTEMPDLFERLADFLKAE